MLLAICCLGGWLYATYNIGYMLIMLGYMPLMLLAICRLCWLLYVATDFGTKPLLLLETAADTIGYMPLFTLAICRLRCCDMPLMLLAICCLCYWLYGSIYACYRLLMLLAI